MYFATCFAKCGINKINIFLLKSAAVQILYLILLTGYVFGVEF